MPNSSTSEIQKSCKCILKCFGALASPIQVFLIEASLAKEAFRVAVPQLVQVSLVQVLSIAAALIQASPLISLTSFLLDKLGCLNIMSELATLASLSPVKHGYKIPEKLLKQVDKFDSLTNKNTEMTGLLKKNVSKVVISKEFATPDKIVIFEEILSNIQKVYPVIQAYNDKDKNLMLI